MPDEPSNPKEALVRADTAPPAPVQRSVLQRFGLGKAPGKEAPYLRAILASRIWARLFLFAGIMKLVMPAAKLAALAPQFSVNFLRFIGVVETLGGLGMVDARRCWNG